MCSVYDDVTYGYGLYNKEKANDGNNDPVALQIPNSCVHTLPHVNAWWGVDLGVALAVIGVLFTSRAEGYGNVSRLCTLSVAMLKDELLLLSETLVNAIDIVFCVLGRSMNSLNSTELSLESKVYFGGGGVFSPPFNLFFSCVSPCT